MTYDSPMLAAEDAVMVKSMMEQDSRFWPPPSSPARMAFEAAYERHQARQTGRPLPDPAKTWAQAMAKTAEPGPDPRAFAPSPKPRDYKAEFEAEMARRRVGEAGRLLGVDLSGVAGVTKAATAVPSVPADPWSERVNRARAASDVSKELLLSAFTAPAGGSPSQDGSFSAQVDRAMERMRSVLHESLSPVRKEPVAKAARRPAAGGPDDPVSKAAEGNTRTMEAFRALYAAQEDAAGDEAVLAMLRANSDVVARLRKAQKEGKGAKGPARSNRLAVKAGRRHSAADLAHLRAARDKLNELLAGQDDDGDDDDTSSTTARQVRSGYGAEAAESARIAENAGLPSMPYRPVAKSATLTEEEELALFRAIKGTVDGAEVPVTELETFEPTRVDGVRRAANGFPILLLKAVGGLAKAAGVADGVAGAVIKAAEDRRYTLAVAYPANKPDAAVAADGHIDFAGPEAVENAAWTYLRKSPKVGLWHATGTEGAGEVVESYIYRGEPWAVKGTDGRTSQVMAGDWLLGIVWNEQAWHDVKKGLIGGVSPQGVATRREPSAAALAGLRQA